MGAPNLPQGSYQRQCFDCSVQDNKLHCNECFRDDVAIVQSSIVKAGCNMFGFDEDAEALYCENKDELEAESTKASSNAVLRAEADTHKGKGRALVGKDAALGK